MPTAPKTIKISNLIDKHCQDKRQRFNRLAAHQQVSIGTDSFIPIINGELLTALSIEIRNKHNSLGLWYPVSLLMLWRIGYHVIAWFIFLCTNGICASTFHYFAHTSCEKSTSGNMCCDVTGNIHAVLIWELCLKEQLHMQVVTSNASQIIVLLWKIKTMFMYYI